MWPRTYHARERQWHSANAQRTRLAAPAHKSAQSETEASLGMGLLQAAVTGPGRSQGYPRARPQWATCKIQTISPGPGSTTTSAAALASAICCPYTHVASKVESAGNLLQCARGGGGTQLGDAISICHHSLCQGRARVQHGQDSAQKSAASYVCRSHMHPPTHPHSLTP